MKKRVYQKIASAMEIPADLSEKAALVEVSGQNELRVENYLGILEYSQTRLLLQCRDCRLEICGKELFVISYAKEELRLQGRIEQVHYF